MAGAQTLGGEWQSRQHAGGEGPIWGCSLGKPVSLFKCCHPCRDMGGLTWWPLGVGVRLQYCTYLYLSSSSGKVISLLSLLEAKPFLRTKCLKTNIEALTAAKYHWLQGSHSFSAVWSFSYIFLCWGLAWSFHSCVRPMLLCGSN